MDKAILYNGEVELVLDNRHRYAANGKWKPGVTTIVGVIGKGDALVQWGVNCAVDALRERLKGELTDEQLEDAYKIAKRAWRDVKQEACNVGTLAHDWLEHYLKGETLALPENPQAQNSIEAALKWIKEHNYRTVAVESLVYSKKYKYAGKLDWLAEIDGELSLPDWKTSSGIWDEYRYQTAAYQQAYQEETDRAILSRWIVRIDKETAEFDPLYIPNKDFRKDFKAFKGALEIYKRKRELERSRS